MRITLFMLCLLQLFCLNLSAATGGISGKIVDPRGVPLTGVHLTLINKAGTLIGEAKSDAEGNFILEGIEPGQYQLTAEENSFVPVISNVSVVNGQQKQVSLQFRQLASVSQAITVVASAPSILTPDPAQSVVVHDQVLDANPGRPGAPISIPGLPIETASGGIKAPQYFAPGVAGDHGEPIAQYFQIADFLYPNNLPANAHGNGYADPNFLIPSAIEAVTVDGGAFDVRQGNNSVDLAASYVPRSRLNSFVQITGDYRDADVMAGWSPSNRDTNAWLGTEISFGNGVLDRLEHRQQYKLNGLRQFNLGRHQLTLFGIGYYGFSYVPGLIPIHVPVPGDTIDDRQLDRTHTFLLVATDNWKLSEQSQFSFSGFFRNYALVLRSNFGDGLIQQSETRNVAGGEATYVQNVRPWLSLLAGVDVRRDAPRDLDLKHADPQGLFQPVTSNNLTLSFVEPFVSLDGIVAKHFHYDLGVRQEQVWMDNQDIINPQNSFNRLATLTLPKGTLTVLPPDDWYVPTVAFSYGEAFHAEDPRIGNGTGKPTLLAPSRAYQLVLSKEVKQTQLSITLRRVSNSQELTKIDPDTGLQQVVGPSLNKVLWPNSAFDGIFVGRLFIILRFSAMKLIRIGEVGREKPGVLLEDGTRLDVSGLGTDYDEAFFAHEGLSKLRGWLAQNAASVPHASATTRLGPPICRPSKIVCIGLNFRDHAEESGMEIPKEPVIFFKATSSLVGPNDPLVIPKNATKVDWEVELAIVMEKRATYVTRENALDYVAAFTLHNDYSERSFQLERGGQWVKGKSADSFAPLGPFLATKDEIPDFNQLRMWLKVNGEFRQRGSTSKMICDVPGLVAYVSEFMTLLPGDVISTGTPPGVGLGMKPPQYLKPGDVVELGIDGLGESRQDVVAYTEARS